MKEYKLLKWYPSLVNEWNTDTPVVVVAGFNEYRLHPSLNGRLRLTIVDQKEVENNSEFWEEIVPKTTITDNEDELLKAFEEYKGYELGDFDIPTCIQFECYKEGYKLAKENHITTKDIVEVMVNNIVNNLK